MKKMKIVASLLSAALLMLASVPTSLAAATKSSSTIEVNGKAVKENILVVEGDNTISVPIASIAKAAGDNVKWNNKTQTATINQKDASIEISANRSVAGVNGKNIPLENKTINGVNVPSGAKATIIGGRLYVPIEATKTVFGYNVKVNRTETNRLDLAYPVPSDWVAPQIKSTATEDYQKNRRILEDELGFQRGIRYNPYGKDAYESLFKIAVGLTEGSIADIDFLAWYGDKKKEHVSNTIPRVSRELFRFYLPKEYNKLFKIIDDGYNGKNVSEYIGKPFVLDGRTIMITENERSVNVKISKK